MKKIAFYICVVLAVGSFVNAGRLFFEGQFLLSVFALLLAGYLGHVVWKTRMNQASPDTHVKCPDCKELVLKDANICKHCGCKLVPQ
jgi:hypothetical protein